MLDHLDPLPDPSEGEGGFGQERKTARQESRLGTDLARPSASDEGGLKRQRELFSVRVRLTQESALRAAHRRLIAQQEYGQRRAAKDTSPSKIAKVLGVQTNGAFRVATSDGVEMLNVQNAIPRSKWLPGTWVTIEQVAQDWQIVGFAPQGAGNPELSEEEP